MLVDTGFGSDHDGGADADADADADTAQTRGPMSNVLFVATYVWLSLDGIGLPSVG